ncbi:MAG: hypothetical protein A3J97_12720 [Spirochaetes bacterium RIFOXYC1_FULL_54_7]|nr:MAG: hypothetical protein A3J97_12720 [Spirochaetes bacterium RIFOXYC1_FULL_54_7]
MPRTLRNVALLMMIFVSTISAQSSQGIVRISPFTGSGIPASELATLERLVASHVAELRLFRVIDDAGREMALGETEIALSLGYQSNTLMPLTADFILSGNLGRIGDLYVFTLENTRVSSGEKISVSDTSSSINDTVLHARSLTRNLFGKADEQAATRSGGVVPSSTQPGTQSGVQPDTQPDTQDSSPPGIQVPGTSPSLAQMPGTSPSLAQVAGTWRGDRGLETVRLFPNGTGMGVLSGGGTMRLRMTLDENLVVVTQDQENDVAMYRSSNFSFDVAKQIAKLARPMKWIFRLSADGQNLEGVKESILVSGTSSSVTVDNDYVREASWTRISR